MNQQIDFDRIWSLLPKIGGDGLSSGQAFLSARLLKIYSGCKL